MTRGLSSRLDPIADWHLVFVRLALGLPILIHGLGKVGIGPAPPGSIGAFSGFLANQGIPAASVFAPIVTVVEIGGGLAVILGFLTRYAAVLIAIDMLVAVLVVHVPNGYLVANGGMELALTLFLLAVALVLTGGGRRLNLERAALGTEY